MCVANSLSTASLVPDRTTSAPCLANDSAMACPMPPVAPVIKAVCPLSENIYVYPFVIFLGMFFGAGFFKRVQACFLHLGVFLSKKMVYSIKKFVKLIRKGFKAHGIVSIYLCD
jgi:hypothetical protein